MACEPGRTCAHCLLWVARESHGTQICSLERCLLQRGTAELRSGTEDHTQPTAWVLALSWGLPQGCRGGPASAGGIQLLFLEALLF